VSKSECGKVAYATHDLAQQAMYHYQSIKKKGQKAPIRVYYCHECERFHLSSEPKNKIGDFLLWLMRFR